MLTKNTTLINGRRLIKSHLKCSLETTEHFLKETLKHFLAPHVVKYSIWAREWLHFGGLFKLFLCSYWTAWPRTYTGTHSGIPWNWYECLYICLPIDTTVAGVYLVFIYHLTFIILFQLIHCHLKEKGYVLELSLIIRKCLTLLICWKTCWLF